MMPAAQRNGSAPCGLGLFDLTGRTAFVTGGNRGLGKAMALALRDAGARVKIGVRDGSADADGLEPVLLDLADRAALTHCFDELAADPEGLDILVNNAGMFAGHSAHSVGYDEWDHIVQVNLTASVFAAQRAAALMRRAGRGGKIINIGSMYSLFGHPSSVGYAATKTAILGVTRSLAAEFGADGIQVNAILPGWLETAINGDLPQTPRGEDIRRRTAAGRWGQPRDMAGAVIFMASAASDFITGTTLALDGGYSVADRPVRD
jgi:2-dehydro-3-deoxy-D-gluconate 5-dehydrogenase